MGILSNIVASSLSIEVLRTRILYVSLATWLVLALFLVTVVATYLLILTPKGRQVAIYTNLMVDRDPRVSGALGAKYIHSSVFAPLAIQRAELLWRALAKDGSPLADQILEDLHKSESDGLSLDLVEYLIFHVVLSGFEPHWASGIIESYGYPTYPQRLGEIPRIRPSTIYSVEDIKPEPRILTRLRQFTQIEYRDLRPVIKGNQFVKHFLGSTSLEMVYSPRNWLLFTPKGTRISVQRTGRERTIRLSNRYSTISLSVTKSSVGLGLPYGIRIREKNYDERSFFTTDFRIDFKTHFCRLLSFHPKIDDYDNWTRLMLRKLVVGFSLSRKGVIEEIEEENVEHVEDSSRTKYQL